MINVTIWNEFVHEQEDNQLGERCRQYYPQGIHNYLKDVLGAEDLNIRAVSLDQPEQGLPEEILNTTDVLLWWGHCRHNLVEDALVDRIQQRVLGGMGLVVLHSGHKSKIFMRMMGTTCNLTWRYGDRERVWVCAPNHPVVQGVDASFALPTTEMYGEPFDIPDDGKLVLASWFNGGNVFRSGVAYDRGLGKVFYFSPGHETDPIYHNSNVQKVISNAIRWVAPINPIVTNLECPCQAESLEPRN